MNKNKTVLISFYTEDKPHDNGIDLTIQKNLFLEKNQKLFDKVILYSPRELIKKNKKWESIFFNQEFYNLHKSTKQRKSSINKNWIKLNSMLWKPAILMETLNNSDIPDNSIIIYHDINLIKYPYYLNNFDNLKKIYFEKLRHKSIALCQDSFFKLSNDCKQEVIKRYLGVSGSTLLHIWAGCFGIKKNKLSIDFCKYWLDLTIIDENRSQLTKFDSYPGFSMHSQEQATLSIAYYKWKYNFSRSINITSFFTINHREILLKWSFKNKFKYIIRLCKFHLKNNILKFFFERIVIVYFSNFRNF